MPRWRCDNFKNNSQGDLSMKKMKFLAPVSLAALILISGIPFNQVFASETDLTSYESCIRQLGGESNKKPLYEWVQLYVYKVLNGTVYVGYTT